MAVLWLIRHLRFLRKKTELQIKLRKINGREYAERSKTKCR
jgi:hypothetical protein